MKYLAYEQHKESKAINNIIHPFREYPHFKPAKKTEKASGK